MDNFLVSVKKFFSNKNTVTVIGVLVAVAILYVGYNWRVKQAVTLIDVPVSTQEIGSRTLITKEMITYMSVPQSLVNKSQNIVVNESLIVGKYVSFGTTIAANSMFYSSQLLTSQEMPDSAFANIPDKYTIYSLGVNLQSTYGNSIFPGNYIDLYFKAIDDAGKVMFGKIIESIEVLAVKDNAGNHVFESTVEERTPSVLLFAVPDDMFDLLKKAEYITGNSIEVIPVPRNAAYTANPGETQVSSEYIKEFILSKTTYIPANTVVTEPETETPAE